jgi:cytochrome P450
MTEILIFLASGHETSSIATTWPLCALAKHPQVQARLRNELQSSGLGDEPSMTELDKLPYLNNVVRETLRVYPAAPNIGREAATDTVVPVGKSFKDRNGVSQMEIR